MVKITDLWNVCHIQLYSQLSYSTKGLHHSKGEPQCKCFVVSVSNLTGQVDGYFLCLTRDYAQILQAKVQYIRLGIMPQWGLKAYFLLKYLYKSYT